MRAAEIWGAVKGFDLNFPLKKPWLLTKLCFNMQTFHFNSCLNVVSNGILKKEKKAQFIQR